MCCVQVSAVRYNSQHHHGYMTDVSNETRCLHRVADCMQRLANEEEPEQSYLRKSQCRSCKSISTTGMLGEPTKHAPAQIRVFGNGRDVTRTEQSFELLHQMLLRLFQSHAVVCSSACRDRDKSCEFLQFVNDLLDSHPFPCFLSYWEKLLGSKHLLCEHGYPTSVQISSMEKESKQANELTNLSIKGVTT